MAMANESTKDPDATLRDGKAQVSEAGGMTLRGIGHFVSPFEEKFGTPRQSGVVESVPGEIRLDGEFRTPDALRGIEGFDWIWVIWGFSLNKGTDGGFKATVRPPRLGGNGRMGVFATRSPYRPNPVGLSSVRVSHIDFDKCVIHVLGADMVNGTPIYDIKPYVPYADSHPEARGGFCDGTEWRRLHVTNPERLAALVGDNLAPSLLSALENDPRPRYQDEPGRTYGLRFAGRDIRFTVDGDSLTVVRE